MFQIVNLKTEMNQKTSRWGAAQARIRTQMKQLENHNNELKEEIEKLRKSSASKKVILIKFFDVNAFLEYIAYLLNDIINDDILENNFQN